jgi:hypothetical protein
VGVMTAGIAAVNDRRNTAPEFPIQSSRFQVISNPKCTRELYRTLFLLMIDGVLDMMSTLESMAASLVQNES